MDLTSVRCLINSISRFIHLVTCRISKTMPTEQDYRAIASFLKHLKPVLDDLADSRAPLDETLSKECDELDVAVNEAREFLEKWSPRMSKISCILKSKPLFVKIQISSIKLSCTIHRSFESSQNTSGLSNAQFCMEESQKLKLGELSGCIEEILRDQKEGKSPDSEQLVMIIESLGLRSNDDLLTESIALEKERQKDEENKLQGELDEVPLTVDLMSDIRGCAMGLQNFKSIHGIPIPSYFQCPLSLKLMSDPVIIASGQTYERPTIQKWLDHGLTTCPTTGNKLSHKNLIPNHTVKALIINWCKENKVQLFTIPEDRDGCSVQCPSEKISHENDLQRKTSTIEASSEVGRGFEVQSADVSPRHNEEGYCGLREETAKNGQSSPEHSYVHSRSESVSSAISSIDYSPAASTEASRISCRRDEAGDRSVDITSACLTSSLPDKISMATPAFSGKQYSSSKTMAEMVNGSRNTSRTLSFSSDSEYNDLTTTSNVDKLVKDLRSESTDLQTAAARELRYLAKYNTENRLIIGQCGAIGPLISLLCSDMELTQEHAVTALLNLSINENIKTRIAEEGALDPLIHVLRTGNAGAKENAAAALFSISLLQEYRIKIGRSGAVKALVDLLGTGTIRGKKDAATALFNLSIYHENKARIIQAGAVKHLIRLLEPESEMIDKAVAVLANLSTITEGCSAIAREGGIPSLVEIIEAGSQRGKENSASILLQMCLNSPKYCRSVLQEGAVPPLVTLSQSGTPRAKEKAQQLLSHFRNQRESAVARGRS